MHEKAIITAVKALSSETKKGSSDTGGKAVSKVEVKDYAFFREINFDRQDETL